MPQRHVFVHILQAAVRSPTALGKSARLSAGPSDAPRRQPNRRLSHPAASSGAPSTTRSRAAPERMERTARGQVRNRAQKTPSKERTDLQGPLTASERQAADLRTRRDIQRQPSLRQARPGQGRLLVADGGVQGRLAAGQDVERLPMGHDSGPVETVGAPPGDDRLMPAALGDVDQAHACRLGDSQAGRPHTELPQHVIREADRSGLRGRGGLPRRARITY